MKHDTLRTMKQLGFLCAIGAAITWGVAYAIDQKVLEKVSPLTFMFFHAFFVLLILLPFILVREWQGGVIRSVFSAGGITLFWITCALCLTMLGNGLIYYAIRYLGASTAAIFEIAYPFFVVLFSMLLFGTNISMYVGIGGLLIFFGAFIIIRFG